MKPILGFCQYANVMWRSSTSDAVIFHFGGWLCVFQGRLNELMSQIRMQNHFGAVRSEERYSVDGDLLREIKQVRLAGEG